MTDGQLAEIEARLRAASKLWFAPGYQRPTLITNAVEDLILVTHAPADILVLLAEVRRLKAEIERLREYRVDDAPLCDECGVNHYPGANTLCRRQVAAETLPAS